MLDSSWVGLLPGNSDKNHRKAREFMVLEKVLSKCWTIKSKPGNDGSKEKCGLGELRKNNKSRFPDDFWQKEIADNKREGCDWRAQTLS